MKLWHKVVLGLVFGIAFGWYVPEGVLYIKPIGDIFLCLIKMVIAPLIFFSLVSGITSMADPQSLSRISIKATTAFLGTTFFAVLFGISIALLLKPGIGIKMDFGLSQSELKATSFSIVEFFVNSVPNNVVGSFAEGNIIQVVFFAIFTGVVLNKMGDSVTQIKTLFHSMSQIILKMISIISKISPYAAFALIAWAVGTQGIDIMISLSKLVIAVVIAMLAQYLIFGILILVFCRISPIPFYKKSLEYQILAFSTSSSKATLPTAMRVCREHLGVSEASTSFVLPLGASLNMNGFAINLGLATIFFAQLLGITLGVYEYLIIILTSTFGSIGGAGIPGASLIMLPMVLSSVNLPIEGVAILAGIDRILDMLRTTINITGGAAITLIIDHSEGSFNREKYCW